MPYSLWTSSRALADSDRFRRHGDVVLRECARHGEGVVESRHVARRIGVAFDGEPGDPRLSTCGSTDRRFAKRGVVPIALHDFAELVIVALSRDRGARGHHVPALDQELRRGHRRRTVASPALRRRAGRSPPAPRPSSSPAFAILVGEAGRGEEGPTVAAIPEHAWTHDGSRISWEIGPRVIIDVVGFLPVSATQQRGAPAARQRAGKKGDRIRRTARRAIEQELLLRLAHLDAATGD